MALTAYLLLLGLALTSYASYKPRFTANFDNLTAPAVSDPVPDVGTYEFITYNSFSLGDTADEVVGGIAAYTEPNAIVTNSEQQGIDGTPSLTIAEPYTFLDLTDFWFGCSLHTGLAAVGLATQCTIVVAGFQSNSDIEIALASFTFTPPPLQDSLTPVAMIHAKLPFTFFNTGIRNVTIIQNDPTTQTLLIDSVSYFAYK